MKKIFNFIKSLFIKSNPIKEKFENKSDLVFPELNNFNEVIDKEKIEDHVKKIKTLMYS